MFSLALYYSEPVRIAPKKRAGELAFLVKDDGLCALNRGI